MFHAKRLGRALLLALVTTGLLALAAGAAESPSGLSGVVNVNTASVEELQRLPGIGEARARAVIDMRRERGGFKSVEELKDVKGIGDASFERLRPYVRLQGKTTAQ